MDSLAPLSWLDYYLPALLLTMCRTSGFFVISPLISRKGVPNSVKAGLCLLMSIVVVSTVPIETVPVFDGLDFVILCLRDLAAGWIMGFAVAVILSAVSLAGQIMDIQVGFSMAKIWDAASGTRASLMGTFFNLAAIVVFLLIGGHESLIRLFYLSYQVVPMGEVSLPQQLWIALPELFLEAFKLGVRIALPVLVVLLVAQSLLGLMARAIPQINFFVVGIPVKIMVGLAVVLAVIPIFIDTMPYLVGRMLYGMQGVINLMRGG